MKINMYLYIDLTIINQNPIILPLLQWILASTWGREVAPALPLGLVFPLNINDFEKHQCRLGVLCRGGSRRKWRVLLDLVWTQTKRWLLPNHKNDPAFSCLCYRSDCCFLTNYSLPLSRLPSYQTGVTDTLSYCPHFPTLPIQSKARSPWTLLAKSPSARSNPLIVSSPLLARCPPSPWGAFSFIAMSVISAYFIPVVSLVGWGWRALTWVRS